MRIRGREFQVQSAPFVMEGQAEPRLGIRLNVVSMECPMPMFDGTQVRQCGVWMDIALDFAPIAYVCQVCGGIIVIDLQSQAYRYVDADFVIEITEALALYFYPANNPRSTDVAQFQVWFSRRSPSATLALATIHNPEMQAELDRIIGKGRALVLPRLYPLDQLRGLIECERFDRSDSGA